jgi:hypothetical protein
MKKVIDANYFQDPALEQYLGADRRNKVVFTEYACMELFKPIEMEPIRRSLKIASSYPKQVIVLKGTSQIIKLKYSSSGLQRRLEDAVQTNGFKEFCEVVDLAARGQSVMAAKLRKRAESARSKLVDLMRDPTPIVKTIGTLTASYDRDQVKALRNHKSLSTELRSKVIKNILLLAGVLFEKHLPDRAWPEFYQMRNNYLFRFATSMHLLALNWIAVGGIANSGVEKLRNDLVDMSYVAYATYFDGLLSRDKKMQVIYREARFFIEQVFHPE